MEQQLIKTLLSNSTFLTNQANLRRTLFSGEYAYIYDKIKEAHEKYARDLTLDEVYSLWLIDNPVATPAEIHEIRDVIDQLKRVEALGEDITTDVITKLWRADIGREIANIGINMAEGDTGALSRLQSLIESVVLQR